MYGIQVMPAGNRHLGQPAIDQFKGAHLAYAAMRLPVADQLLAEGIRYFPKHIILTFLYDLFPDQSRVIAIKHRQDLADFNGGQPFQQGVELHHVLLLHQ